MHFDLVFNENAYKTLPERKKSLYVYEWLCHLDRCLNDSLKTHELKVIQSRIVDQLLSHLFTLYPGPQIRFLIGKNVATIYSIGNVMSLHDTLYKCHSFFKSKDDHTQMQLFARLSALNVIAALYEKLGRIVGRSYEDTIHVLLRFIKHSDTNMKIEVIKTLESIVVGMNVAALSSFKDLFYKLKNYLYDKNQEIRLQVAKCLTNIVKYASFSYTNDLDTNVSICMRIFDTSNTNCRAQIACLLATLLYHSLSSKHIDDRRAFSYLMQGFSRQNSKFLKVESTSATWNSLKTRLGVTLSFVELARLMSNSWLEKNLHFFVQNTLQLSESQFKSTTHLDCVFSRKCIHFILSSIVNQIYHERFKLEMAKTLISILKQNANNNEAEELIIPALYELSCLIAQLSSSTIYLLNSDSDSCDTIEVLLQILGYKNRSVKVYASWCLRTLAISLPMLLTPLLDRCIAQLSATQTSQDAINEYGLLSVALIGGVHSCSLGIPSLKAKLIFNLGEEFCTHNAQNVDKIRIGWLMLSSFMTLGYSIVKKHLPRMYLLWKSTIQKGHKDLQNEIKSNGLLTWQLSLESRSGVLTSINSLLVNCGREDLLMEEDFLKRVSSIIDSAILLLSELPNLHKIHGNVLKSYAAWFRLRLYQVLDNLPSNLYEPHLNILLRELVAEITLTDNSQSNIVTSMLRQTCNSSDFSLAESEFKLIDHLTNLPLSLEHDISCLYQSDTKKSSCEGTMPLGINVLDASISLFGQIFVKISNKYRHQMLTHFTDLLKTSKSTNRQTLHTNISTALYWSLKNLNETKTFISDEHILRLFRGLIIDNLSSSCALMRCASADALGRLSQIANNVSFMNELAEFLVDRLNSRDNSRDFLLLSGYSLALGCLHRYIGGMGAGKHLTNGVSTLFKFAQDSSLSVVQIWAIHALVLIVDSGVSMFRAFIEPCIQIIVQCCLDIQNNQSDVYLQLARLLAALLTLLGPELQDETQEMSEIRLNCLVTCQILQEHSEALVKAESIKCFQELHMFTPKYVNLKKIIPNLIATLVSSDLVLRKASVSCIRQLCQKESIEVCEQAKLFVSEAKITSGLLSIINESGLEGLLFKLLDIENDDLIKSDIRDTINSIFSCLNDSNLRHWILLLKEIAISKIEQIGKGVVSLYEKDSLKEGKHEDSNKKEDEEEEEVNDGEVFKSNENDDANLNLKNITPKWPNQVFAVNLLRNLITQLYNKHSHLTSVSCNNVHLILYLQDLMQVALKTAGNINDSLKIANLELLQDIIFYFSKVEEPEFKGHFILEQYQAAIGANLRPHFSLETSSYVTAKACQVCSSWITCGVAINDFNGLKKIHNLLKSSLDKLDINEIQAFSLPQTTTFSISMANLNKYLIYSEICLTVEKLAVLRAWAEVYIVAVRDFNGDDHSQNLLHLVEGELDKLSEHWAMFLKDYALISLSNEYYAQLPNEGGSFYHSDLIDVCRVFYKEHWTKVLLAYSIWIRENRSKCLASIDTYLCASLESLSNPSASTELSEEELVNLLQAICNFLKSISLDDDLSRENDISIELLSTLYRVKLTHDLTSVHILVLIIIKELILMRIDSEKNNNDFIKIALSICTHDCIKYFSHSIYSNDSKLLQRNQKILVTNLEDDDLKLIMQVLNTLRHLFQLCDESSSTTFISIAFTLVINLLDSHLFVQSNFAYLQLLNDLDDAIFRFLEFLCSCCDNEINLRENLAGVYTSFAIKLLMVESYDSIKLMRFFSTFVTNNFVQLTTALSSNYNSFVARLCTFDSKQRAVYVDNLNEILRDVKNYEIGVFLVKQNLKFLFSKDYFIPQRNNFEFIEALAGFIVCSSEFLSNKSNLLEVYLLLLGDSVLNNEVSNDFSQILTKIIVILSDKFKLELKNILGKNERIKKRIEQVVQSTNLNNKHDTQKLQQPSINGTLSTKKIELSINFAAFQK